MDSPQSVMSPVRKASVVHDSDKHDSVTKTGSVPKEIDFQNKTIASVDESDDFLGALEVFIHQARDIHNICIYQKQDVYAKLCLTSDPEKTVSTKIINGGGRNPIFNENLGLNVRTVDSSLKCEIWMLSRVRNYLEDQLLGFALVPVYEILLHNGKLDKEFSLSSTDLFHSPAGFVQLTVSYVGAQPEVLPITVTPSSVDTETAILETSSVFDSIEFPDPQVVNETNKMVEQYFALDSQVISEVPTPISTEAKSPAEKIDSPTSSDSTASKASKVVQNEEHVSPPLENPNKISPSNSESSSERIVNPFVLVKYEPDPKVDQQEIVDLYMKSMQQFTESLAKMKLPMDIENGATSTESSTGSEQKTPASGSRVFYGSRAFF